MIDLSSISINFALMICAFIEIDEPTYTSISAVAVILIYLWAFYFNRIFLSTAVVIAMIVEIVKEMFWFLMVLVFFVLGFGMSFFILLRNTTD